VLAGVAFAAVNQALVAVLGGIGRWLAAVIGVAALGAGIISTLPGWLAAIAGFLPTRPRRPPARRRRHGLGDRGARGLDRAGAVATTLAVTARRTTSAKAVLALAA
jgi:putative membrane protein